MSKRNEFADFDNGHDDSDFEAISKAMIGFDLPTPKQTNQIAVFQNDGQLYLHGFQLTRRGLIPPQNATKEEWLDIGQFLFAVEDGIQLLIGDYLVGIEHEYGVTFKQLAEATGKSEKTLRNYKTVAGSINLSLRKDTLYFGHYNLLQAMKPKEQKQWIELASKGDTNSETDESAPWSVARLTKEIKRAKGEIKTTTESWYDSIERDVGKFTPQKYNKLSHINRQKLRQIFEGILNEMDRLDNSR